MASALIENGFMDSRTDVPIILSDVHARKTAEGIVEFIVDHFKLKKKTVVKPSAATVTHRVRVDGKQVGAYAEVNNILNIVEKNLGKKLIEIEKI